MYIKLSKLFMIVSIIIMSKNKLHSFNIGIYFFCLYCFLYLKATNTPKIARTIWKPGVLF